MLNVFRNRRRAKLVQEPVTGSAFPVSDIRVRPRAGTSESPTLIHSSKLSTDGSSKVGGIVEMSAELLKASQCPEKALLTLSELKIF